VGKVNAKESIGVYYYANGNVYEGIWEADIECGRGTL